MIFIKLGKWLFLGWEEGIVIGKNIEYFLGFWECVVFRYR